MMKCARCGARVPENVRFCTSCGYEFQQIPFGDPYRQEDVRPAKKSNALLYVMLGVVLLLLIATTIALFSGGLGSFFGGSHDGNSSAAVPTATASPVIVITSAPTAMPTPTPLPTPTPMPTPSPAPVYDPSAELDAALAAYFDAFIQDINRAEYRALYGAVESGSAMEQTQKDFITKSAGKNLIESLRNYQIISRSRISDSSYQITATETYEIWQSESPTHSLLTQRCTYLVNRQYDGSWKVADFVGGVEVVDRIDY